MTGFSIDEETGRIDRTKPSTIHPRKSNAAIIQEWFEDYLPSWTDEHSEPVRRNVGAILCRRLGFDPDGTEISL